MNKLFTTNGKASSMPAGLVWGGVSGMISTLVLSALLAWMIVEGKLRQNQMGYGIMVILTVSAFLGAKTAFAKVQRRRLMVCTGAGAVYFAMLLSVTALFFGGQFSGVGETALMILCGCGMAFLLKKPAGNGIRAPKIKARYC